MTVTSKNFDLSELKPAISSYWSTCAQIWQRRNNLLLNKLVLLLLFFESFFVVAKTDIIKMPARFSNWRILPFFWILRFFKKFHPLSFDKYFFNCLFSYLLRRSLKKERDLSCCVLKIGGETWIPFFNQLFISRNSTLVSVFAKTVIAKITISTSTKITLQKQTTALMIMVVIVRVCWHSDISSYTNGQKRLQLFQMTSSIFI